MNIFADLNKYGQPKKTHKNYFEYTETPEEVRQRQQQVQVEQKETKEIKKKKPRFSISSFFRNVLEAFRCLFQLLFVLVCAVLIILIAGWLFKGCGFTDPDSLNFDYGRHF